MYSKNIKVTTVYPMLDVRVKVGLQSVKMGQVDDEDEDDDDPNKTYDLIILGLPWKTSEDDIREYFEVSGLNIISLKT